MFCHSVVDLPRFLTLVESLNCVDFFKSLGFHISIFSNL